MFGRKKTAEEWCEKGVAFCELGKYVEGFRCFDKAFEINPNFAEVWHSRGVVFGKLCKHEKAIKCFDKVKKIESNDEIYKK